MYGGTLQKLKNSFSPLIILAKSFIIEVWLGPKYASDMDDERFNTAKSKSNSTRSHIFRVHIYSKDLLVQNSASYHSCNLKIGEVRFLLLS